MCAIVPIHFSCSVHFCRFSFRRNEDSPSSMVKLMGADANHLKENQLKPQKREMKHFYYSPHKLLPSFTLCAYIDAYST